MTRMTMRTVPVAIAFIACGLLACSDQTTDPTDPGTSPIGRVTGHTTCKAFGTAAGRYAVPREKDCIEYAYDGHSVLQLKHVNAGFNCCPDSLIAAFQIDSGEIIIDEADVLSDGCHCLCLYDLEYQISNLPLGQYHVRVNQPYLRPGADVLEFTVDLQLAPSGTYCVTRDFYPWGGE